ncbi:GNAT family N-acetyltransferase [Geodermatophilus sp. YIM 151500]|uniref:GNAT family N-acetyltransferase n=1 Tax=Geodermatophilus sp. YIM 151500 TaxID=2984531 RepID=UPI0021E3F6E5|nr:GNAT family protein [Geodermatophilus sp. YIM 151500]MCV2487910.1 GNAT family N-acetyltransferase [Geodermatophilus sp. YIM 151500]
MVDVAVRPVRLEDAAPLAALLRADREVLAPWEPVRDGEWSTEEGQRRELRRVLERAAADAVLPCVVLVDGEPAGRVNVNNVVRGAFQSGDLGYWIASPHTGRGVATAAVAAVARRAFADPGDGGLGLHRLQAGTLPHNAASRRVLERNGFTRIGCAPRYLRIAGRWQDHVLYQLLAPEDRAGPGPDAGAPAQPGAGQVAAGNPGPSRTGRGSSSRVTIGPATASTST